MGRKARLKRERVTPTRTWPHHGDGTLPTAEAQQRIISAAVRSIQQVITGPLHQLCLYHTAVVGALADTYLQRSYALSIGTTQFGTSEDRHSLEMAGTVDAPQSYHAWLFRKHPGDRIELVDATWRYFPVTAQSVGFTWERTLPAYYWGWWDGSMEDAFDVQYRFHEEKYRRFVRETDDPAFVRAIGTVLAVADMLYERPQMVLVGAPA